MSLPMLVGCDFSSSPTRRKPIVLAIGELRGSRLQLRCLQTLETLEAFEVWARQGTWIGGFDMPFGLPRELVQSLGWPATWEACIRHYATLSRAEIRAVFAAFCNARPAGSKFAHRATDGPAHSSPSMKWVNPPVAYMLHAGVPRLLDAGVYFPGLQAAPLPTPESDTGTGAATATAMGAEMGPATAFPSTVPRVALEAYPGLLAREVLGSRSYKSDDRAKQTPERLIARKDLVNALELGQTRLGIRLLLSHAQRDLLVDDASGDRLDATLCLLQTAWAGQQHVAGSALYGLPKEMDALEGWIITA